MAVEPPPVLTLIRGAELFAPEPAGRQDLLVAGRSILQIAPRIEPRGLPVELVEGRERWLLPGFVDALTHPCGGGGEGGFANRTAEIDAGQFIRAGVTSPVGALGTDSLARSLEVLYGSVMALRERGLAAYMYSGAYRVPAPTLTGDVARDLLLVEPVIGVGEVAVSDHRSSQPTRDELRRLAADVRLGGLLSGKQGTVFVHLGDGVGGLQPLEEALAGSELPRRIFYPTHVNRSRQLLEQAAAWVSAGSHADITVSTTPELVAAGDVPALDALDMLLERGAPAERITFSSDAGGSLPLFRDGALAGLQSASPAVLRELLASVSGGDADRFATVLAGLTCNPATALGLQGKGRLAPGMDADLVLFDPESGAITDLFCAGRALMRGGELAKA